MTHWMEQMLNQNQSLEKVAQGFADSSELAQVRRHGQRGIPRHMYQNVLGRSPDDVGKAYWMEQLKLGTTRARWPGLRSRAGGELMREEVSVTLLYVGLLGRTP